MNLFLIPLLIPWDIFTEFVLSLGLVMEDSVLLIPYLISNFFYLIMWAFIIDKFIYRLVLYLVKFARRKVRRFLWKR